MTSRTAFVPGWCAVLPFTLLLALTACGGGGSSASGGTGGGGGSTLSPSAANEWTWVSGSNSGNGTNDPGVYGTLGVASASNTPGARYGAVSWTDSSGNLWLFGGVGYDSTGNDALNDLWEFDTTTKQWTWVAGSSTANQPAVYGTQGVPSAGNTPGARAGGFSWTDKNGNLWLYGGYANDLWEFDTTTKQWTWVAGSSTANQPAVYGMQGVASAGNTPGARGGGFSWTDKNGNLWLYGGYGRTVSAGDLGDLWMFNITIKQWTWVAGSSAANQPAVYGTQGVASASNIPGGRHSAVGWIDSSGNFWLYGGLTYTNGGDLGDLWEFDTTTKQWTWVGGSTTVNQPAVYGTQGVASASNIPGGWDSAVGWTDSRGNLWLFSGYGDGSTAWSGGLTWGDINTLWEFNTATKQWTWVGGSSTANQPGVYGTLGVASEGNVPGARDTAVGWTDSSGIFWLYGGSGAPNDLWRYQP